jgi:hypothetical protein
MNSKVLLFSVLLIFSTPTFAAGPPIMPPFRDIVPRKFTADPCGTLGEGTIFYNDTGNYMCYCNNSDDVKMADDSACF